MCVPLIGLTQITSSQLLTNNSVNWLELADAERLSEKSNKNMLLFFYRENCEYCEKMKSQTFTDPSVIKLINDNFFPVMINGKSKDPIIYNIVYTDKSEQIISDLKESKLTKVYEIEDCYEVDNLIENINYYDYDYVIYRYNCEQMEYIKSKCNDCKFIHYPHYIDMDVFNSSLDEEKSIDILLYGNISNFYPFRNRLFNLISKSGLKYHYLQHPGYDENEITNTEKVIKNDLSKLINKSKITISTGSAFNYFVKKYLEISASGSIIAGNFPKTEKNLYNDCMCYLDENMSDEQIIDKLKLYLDLNKNDYNTLVKKSYNITNSCFTYKNASDYFNHLLNFIDNHDNKNNQNNDLKQDSNDIVIYDNQDNDLNDIASYDGYKYKCNCNSFKLYINKGLSQPYPRELNIIKSYLEKYPDRNNIYIDIGAHFGTTSIPYSKLYNQIYSFEANKDNYSLLEHNISLNNIKNIRPFNLGIYNKITNCVSHKHDNNSGSIVMKETDIETVDTIKMLPLDNIDFNESSDFIKIDTEGSELFVLEGAKNTIHKYKPLIQVETNHCSEKFFNYNKKKIYDFMYSMNYKILDDDGNDPIFYYEYILI